MQSSIPQKQWKQTQILEQRSKDQKSEDTITALQFDRNGQHIGIGDSSGKLKIFQRSNDKLEYKYLTELQSHNQEYDFFKNSEIVSKINEIQWLRQQGKNLYVLTTNDKIIKLWKISEKIIKKIIKPSNDELSMPKLECVESGYTPNLRKTFPNLHISSINSISIPQNEEFVLSSDNFNILLWNLEQPQKAFKAVDFKPNEQEEYQEYITSSKFHPIFDNIFLYTTSKGIIKYCDMRRSGVCDNTAITLLEEEDQSKKNFFSDMTNFISDACFSRDGKYIFSRDYLRIKIWDVVMQKKPIKTIEINEGLKYKLCELYENDCIFDKFNMQPTADKNSYVTGNYNGIFNIISDKGENIEYKIEKNQQIVDEKSKILKCACCQDMNITAVACLNSLYFYSNL